MNKEQNIQKLETYADIAREQTKQCKYKLRLEKSIASHAHHLEQFKHGLFIRKCLAIAAIGLTALIIETLLIIPILYNP